MLQYIEHIIIPYVENIQEMLYTETTLGLDNFKSKVTEKVNHLLEENHLYVCLLLLNTTDLLQPIPQNYVQIVVEMHSTGGYSVGAFLL